MKKFYDVPGHINAGEFARLYGIPVGSIGHLLDTMRLKGKKVRGHWFVKEGQRIEIDNDGPKRGKPKYIVTSD